MAIPGTSRGLLYVMRSPLFEIEPYRPLQFCAIGSGESAYEEIAKYHDGIVAFHPGNSFIESSFLRDTVQRFLDEKGIESVGGLYPTLKVSGKGTELLGQSATIPVGGPKIELAIKDNRWIQRNHETGKEIRLLYPWEVKGEPITEDYKFDDLKEAYRKFRGED